MSKSNGIVNISYSFFYVKENPSELTFEDSTTILDHILKIKTSQLSKAMYYGMEVLHQILKRTSKSSIKYRDYVMNKLRDFSISYGTQHLEMIADFNQYGQLNGVLNHYYNKCYDSEGEIGTKELAEFVNIALVHSYITGKHDWLAVIFVDLEEDAVETNNNKKLIRIKDLIFELSQYRKNVWDVIDKERNTRTSSEYVHVADNYIANPNVKDDSDKLFTEELSNTSEYIAFAKSNPSSTMNPNDHVNDNNAHTKATESNMNPNDAVDNNDAVNNASESIVVDEVVA
jgi:hypothetical protein